MDRSTEIRDFLNEAMPGACERVGEDIVEDISLGRTNFIKPTGGNYIDLGSIVGQLLAATNLFLALLKLRDELRKMTDSGKPKPETEKKRREAIDEFKSSPEMAVPKRVERVAIKRVFPDL